MNRNGTRSNEVPDSLCVQPRSCWKQNRTTHATTHRKIDVPVEITGQFQTPGDIDYFEFAAKAQEVFWIDVFGHRDGSGADPYLILEQIIEDKDGHEIGCQTTCRSG